MASKGQKLKRYSTELKETILKEHSKGYGWRSLAKMHPEVIPGTIKNWIRKNSNNVDITVDHRKGCSGRPKSKDLTLEDYKERYEILKKYQAFLQARRGKK